jgi:hypothetical protein
MLEVLEAEPAMPQMDASVTPLPTVVSSPAHTQQAPTGNALAAGVTIASVPLETPVSPPVEAPILVTELPSGRPPTPDSGIVVPPYILPPAEAYAGQDLHMITVILRPCADKVRDNLRLRQCYGILISYSGHDRFALQIFERSRGYRIEFPNYTTLFSAELVGRLASIVGADNVIVEPLRLH